MDGVHDLGGFVGLGAIQRETDEPVFHAEWERRVFSILIAVLGQGLANLDEVRHAIERMDPVDYLSSSYYEHWLDGSLRVLVEKGVITREAFEEKARAISGGEATVPHRDDKKLADWLVQLLGAGGSPVRPTDQAARFAIGDSVRVRKMHPKGHTRCPRYVRGARGKVLLLHGNHVFPDANAHGPERAEHLYCVEFRAQDLWGEGSDSLRIDLWESYLDAEV